MLREERYTPEVVATVPRARRLYRFLLVMTRALFKWLFQIKLKSDPAIQKEEGPCLILANHLSYLDPLPAAFTLPDREINFVAGRALFHKPFLRWLLPRVECIPKEQFYPDPGSIVSIVRILKAGGTCLLFPEAQRSYTGAPLPFSPAVAKLVKKLAIPVYTVRLSGCGFAYPRWADQLRFGPIEAELRPFLRPEEIQSLSLEEIQDQLAVAIHHSEAAWQAARPKPARYRSRHLAEGLERILYHCPQCASEEGFVTKGKSLSCLHCGTAYHVDSDYSIHGEGPCPANHEVWAEAQIDRIRARAEAGRELVRSPVSYALLDIESRTPGPASPGRLTVTLEGIYLESDLSSDQAGRLELKTSNEGTAYVSLGEYLQLFGPGGVVYRLTPGSPAELARIVEALQVRIEWTGTAGGGKE